jgi:hypothetical protein
MLLNLSTILMKGNMEPSTGWKSAEIVLTTNLNGNIKTCVMKLTSQPNIVSVTALLPTRQPAAMSSQSDLENASATSLSMQAKVQVLKQSDSRQLMELKMSCMNIRTPLPPPTTIKLHPIL